MNTIPQVPASMHPAMRPLAQRLYDNAMRGCPADACERTVQGWAPIPDSANKQSLVAYGLSVVAALS